MKKARKILVALVAMVMLLGTCMTVSANGTTPEDTPVVVAQVKTITAAKKATVYTNGDAEVTVKYTWDKVKGEVEQVDPSTNMVALKADSNNKGVVKVDSIVVGEPKVSKNGKTATTEAIIKLDAISNGTAKLIVTDASKAKKKEITVTVKTWAKDIEFKGNAVTTDANGAYTVTVANAKNAKVNLGAELTNKDTASNKGIKYSVVEKKTGVTVDAKGNVKFTMKDPKDATIKVISADKNVEKFVKVVKKDEAVTTVTIIQDTTNKKDNTPGLLNGKNVLNMKGNKTSNAYTYQLGWTKGVAADSLLFVSNKPAVAYVDEDGKITAKGNGKATITVSPKYNNTLAKKITVNVTTDVESISVTEDYFEIVANKKATAKIVAKTNTNASNKTVKYALLSVMLNEDADGDGKLDVVETKKEMKEYASVDSKTGVVKMKKSATATVLAYAAADNTVTRIVTVKGIVPVSDMTLKASEDSEATYNKKNKVYTVYRTSATTAQKLEFEAEVNKDATNTAINWSSSKPAVADVDKENGKIIVNGNGTAVITATAADGSGVKKTAKVTVKTDAYELIIAKAQTVSANDVVYVENKTNKAVKYTFSKVIAAKTNADASDKTVLYTVKGTPTASKDIKLKAGETADVLVEAGTARREVKLVCVTSEDAAKKVIIGGLDEEVLLRVGDSVTPTFTVSSIDGKVVVDPTAVKLTTSNKNIVAVKNGTLTAKKAGKATVTAKYADGETTATVYVGRNTAAIEKELEKIATDKLKAENYDYLGVKTKFDAKKNAFALDIIKPTNDIRNIEDTGLVAFAKELYENMQDTLGCNSVEAEINGVVCGAENNMDGFGSAYYVKDGVKEYVLTHVGITEAIDFVVDSVIGDATQLKDWNGMECKVVFNFTDTNEDNKVFNHTVAYSVVSTMNSKYYETTVNAAIAEVMNIDVEGLEFTFDEASHAIEIVVTDTNNTTIAATDAAYRAEMVAALEEVFADAASVTLNAKIYVASEEVPGTYVVANETVTKTNNGQSAEFIGEMLDEYIAKLANNGVVTLADLNGVVMSADVTFKAGAQSYTYTYTANALADESVFDAAADRAIADAVVANTEAFTSGTVAYDATTNKLNVVFNADVADKAIIDFKGEGLTAILNAVINNSAATDAVVITSSTAKHVGLDALEVLSELVNGAEKVADLDGDDATIKVVYTAPNGASSKTVAYTVAFEVAKVAAAEVAEDVETVETVEDVEATEETEETTEEVVEETTEEAIETVEDVEATEETEETVEEVATTEEVA